jgi:hypothetical protein
MALILPKIVVLDSATIAKSASDYWSAKPHLRAKVRKFLDDLAERAVYIGLTFTHLCELLRHRDDALANDRLKFLRQLQFVAWPRPYDRNWFPGTVVDVLARELSAAIQFTEGNWHQIVQAVRPTLWETGTGSEIIIDNDGFWSVLRIECARQHQAEKWIASIGRVNAWRIMDVTVEELLGLQERPADEWEPAVRRFAREMDKQLRQHGDERLNGTESVSKEFARATLIRSRDVAMSSGNFVYGIIAKAGIPLDQIHPKMTVADVGELGVYVEQLQIIARRMRPMAQVDIQRVPPETLPSYVVERELRSIQRTEQRVSGSNMGDAHIAPLILYADALEADKRTYGYLQRVRRRMPELGNLMNALIRSSDYSKIPLQLDSAFGA